MRKLALVLCAPVLLLAASASAHFNLVMPPSSKASTEGGKGDPPCGPDTADGTATPVTGGSSLPISITETVRHGGFYRFALSLKTCRTKDCFPADNKVYDSTNKLLNPTGPGTSDHADTAMNPVFPVLADNMFPHPQDGMAAPVFTGNVPVPNVNCDRCVLQVIEFMAPHGPNGNAGYFYHHCADLKITADPNKPMFDPNNPGGAGGAGGGGAGGSAAGGASNGGMAGAENGGTPGSGGTGGGGSSAAGASSGGQTPTTAGSPTIGGASAGMTSSGMAGSAAGGSGSATPGASAASDDGGCGIARPARGGATALAALGLLLGLARRRRGR